MKFAVKTASETFTALSTGNCYEGIFDEARTETKLDDLAAIWGREVSATVVCKRSDVSVALARSWSGKTELLEFDGDKYMVVDEVHDNSSVTLALVTPDGH